MNKKELFYFALVVLIFTAIALTITHFFTFGRLD